MSSQSGVCLYSSNFSSLPMSNPAFQINDVIGVPTFNDVTEMYSDCGNVTKISLTFNYLLGFKLSVSNVGSRITIE